MAERIYDGTLKGLFSVLDEVCQAAATSSSDRSRDSPPSVPDIAKMISDRIRRGASASQGGAGIGGIFCPGLPDQPELFSENSGSSAGSGEGGKISDGLFPGRSCGEAACMLSLFEDAGPSDAALTGSARDLYAVSADAFDAFVCAWMSELPIEAEIVRYGFKVLTAACRAAVLADWTACEEARLGAEKAGRDRGDADCRAVLAAVYKVNHEIDRMRGFLRFNPVPGPQAEGSPLAKDAAYVAFCAPDHFVLPALASHFTRRFGEQEWAIIDEKRSLCLSRHPGESPWLFRVPLPTCRPLINDDWENLWRHYHRTINNEGRKNPQLQRQFMPERYWKYLPEVNSSHSL